MPKPLLRPRLLSRRGSHGGLDQPRRRGGAVRAIAFRAKAVQRRQLAAWGHFEDCAIVVGPAFVGCPVEVPIGGLDQPRCGAGAVRAIALRAKGVQSRQLAAWGHFEDCAVSLGPRPRLLSA